MQVIQQNSVRIIGLRAEQFVEFEYSPGDPDLVVELIMPKQAFDEFCARENVVTIGELPSTQLQDHSMHCSLRFVTSERFRHTQ
jgi:phenol/toluene 2-monooxygenase (NADH) P0/A0